MSEGDSYVRRPNILFIMADQFRWDAVGAIGGWTRTKHLDWLCQQGVCFQQVIATSVECIPSRLSLATGLYPHQHGIWNNRHCTLNPNFPNWMQAIEAAGYETSLFGKTHLHPHEGDIRDREHLLRKYGLGTVEETTGPRASATVLSNMTEMWDSLGLWEDYKRDIQQRFREKPHMVRPSTLPLEHYYDVYVGRSAQRYLSAQKPGRPWFCWVSFGGPHEPWDAPEPYASMYDPSSLPQALPRMKNAAQVSGLLGSAFASPVYSPELPAEDVASLRANYAGNVTLIDDQVGEILDLVREKGELEDTLIVFTSDHGEMNGDQGLIYKANFLDPALRVPLIIVPPANARKGQTCGRMIESAIVELPDVGATMADYAGAQLPEVSNARSVRPLLEGQCKGHRSYALSGFARHNLLFTEHWKAEFGPAPEYEPSLLINRIADPTESEDLSKEAGQREVVGELRGSLLDIIAATPPLKEAVVFE